MTPAAPSSEDETDPCPTDALPYENRRRPSTSIPSAYASHVPARWLEEAGRTKQPGREPGRSAGS
ncbi:hypothetical protein GS506_01790 [Rhodococcus hoagii]|nr:hypothetical protein [Prescottella equi]